MRMMKEVLWRVVQKAVLCRSEKIHLVLHLLRLFPGGFLRALQVLRVLRLLQLLLPLNLTSNAEKAEV